MHEAKSQLSELVQAVEKRNERIILCRAGEPVAEIVSFQKRTGRLTTDARLRVKLKYDPTEALSSDEIPPEYR